jgi:hypothetical protein
MKSMKDYLFLFRGRLDFSKAPQEQVQQVIILWKNWIDELTKKGIYNGGERLTRNEAAVVRGSARQIFGGSYTANNETLGGYISVKADSLQHAIEICKDCPIFNFDGSVEIREVAKM